MGAEPLDQRVGEEGQLLSPRARGGTDHEHAVVELDGERAVGDARTDDGAPERTRDRRSVRREAILAGAREDRVDGLGGEEFGPSATHEGSRWRKPRRVATAGGPW